MKKSKIIVFDVETTGLSNAEDEILQVSIIDGNNKVLFNEYIKPTHTDDWAEASAINGITKEMVENKLPFDHHKDTIQTIVANAEHYIGYNIWFDIGFLEASGIVFDYDKDRTDVMIDFAEIYGEWNEYYGDFKWQKLVTCAEYYGFDWNSIDESAHNSLGDCYATLHCYKAMKGNDGNDEKQND